MDVAPKVYWYVDLLFASVQGLIGPTWQVRGTCEQQQHKLVNK